MEKLVTTLIFFGIVSSTFAESAPAPPVQEITKQIIQSVTNYANAIACNPYHGGKIKIDSKLIAALVPYKSFEDRNEAKFAVLWDGDIGCGGGSAEWGTNLSIVYLGLNVEDSYLVDILQSTPVIKFDSPVRKVNRLVGNTRDTLILEGYDYSPNDANCCPTVPIRFSLRVDDKGNWKLIEKKVKNHEKLLIE